MVSRIIIPILKAFKWGEEEWRQAARATRCEMDVVAGQIGPVAKLDRRSAPCEAMPREPPPPRPKGPDMRMLRRNCDVLGCISCTRTLPGWAPAGLGRGRDLASFAHAFSGARCGARPRGGWPVGPLERNRTSARSCGRLRGPLEATPSSGSGQAKVLLAGTRVHQGLSWESGRPSAVPR